MLQNNSIFTLKKDLDRTITKIGYPMTGWNSPSEYRAISFSFDSTLKKSELIKIYIR